MPLARQAYPRPRLVRPDESWVNLNGEWAFTFDASATPPQHHDLKITVPFAWETPASGVQQHWRENAWYHREITLPGSWQGSAVTLHLDAVHDTCGVWVDGQHLVDHVGGQTPVAVVIPDELVAAHTDGSPVRIDVQVHAPIDKRHIAKGKQRSVPRTDFDGVDFTPTSGIWKPVWLESTPRVRVVDAWAHPDKTAQGFVITADVAGDPTRVEATVQESGEHVELQQGEAGRWTGAVTIADPQLWSPADPHLYHLDIVCSSDSTHDAVTVYSGLRTIAYGPEGIRLNGRRVTLRAVLDQGYWPSSSLTPPDDDALRRDLQLARDAGFNTVRKHIKIEDAAFVRAADEMGMLIWVEPASPGSFSEASRDRFLDQLPTLVAEVRHSPACIVVCAYNEEWGLDWDTSGDALKQDACRSAYRVLKNALPDHVVIDDSGWEHVQTDVVDWHHYVDDPSVFAATVAAFHDGSSHSFSVRLGPDLVVEKDLYYDKTPPAEAPLLMNSEFGGGFTPVERGWNMKWETQELRRHWAGLGYVYTELYDVEHEPVGIYDTNRVLKDQGGSTSHLIHADTVFVLDVSPRQPGRDVILDGPDVRLRWRLASDCDLPTTRLQVGWTPVFGTTPTAWADTDEVAAMAAGVGEPHELETPFPVSTVCARLHLRLVAGDEERARTWVDVDTRTQPHIGDYPLDHRG